MKTHKHFIKIALVTIVVAVVSTMAVSSQNQSKDNVAVEAAQRLIAAKKLIRSQRKTPPIAEFERIAQENPTNGDIWYRFALALGVTKRYPEAITAYKKALELGAISTKFEANSNYDLACCYAQMGELKLAMTHLEKAIDLGFRDIKLVQTDTDLLPLHHDAKWENLAATKDTSKMSRDEGWQYDLWFLNRELRRIHFRYDNLISVSEFDAQVKKISIGIPVWSDEKILLELKMLTVMANDGHTALWVLLNGNRAPFDMDMYEDGVHVSAVMPGFERLLGQSIVAVNDMPINDFFREFGRWMSKDNNMGILNVLSFYGCNASLLFGAGIIPTKDHLTVTLRSKDGTLKREIFDCKPTNQPSVNPVLDPSRVMWLKNTRTPYWAEMIPNTKTLFFQYNAITSGPPETINQFADKLMKVADENQADRLIIDLRHNGGGNNQTYRMLLRTIVKSRFNESGRLFVIIGRRTFSAAQCFATEVERDTDAIFVGEPSGSRPNFIGEAAQITLPYSKALAIISDLYWQKGQAMDFRMWISPDIRALNTYEEHASGRDVAVEAILKYPFSEK